MPKETKGTAAAVRAFIFAEAGSPRLRPLTEHLPTSLLPVGGIPLLDRQIQALLKCDVQDITVVGGYRAAQVEQACRFYSAVGFRFNPRFSRQEPKLNALRASGPLGKDSILLVCGSLVLDRPLLAPVLASKPDSVLVAERKPIGLYHLLPGTAQALQEAGEEVLANGGADRDLFPFIEDFLEGTKHTRLQPDCPWVRLRSMEDLARALKSHPASLQMPAPPSPKASKGAAPAPVPIFGGEDTPQPPRHLEGPETEDGDGLSHPLLKVFPR